MDKLNVSFLKKYTKKQQEYKEQDDKTKERTSKIEARNESANPTLLQQAEKEKPPIEKVLEDCNYKINDLIYFGTELVSNIKVANEKREIIRRNYEAFRKENLLADLEKESIEAMARYTEIMDKWTELEELKEPMGLYEQLEEQKLRIQELLQQKDAVIKQCQDEIQRVDERYYLDQEKQDLDISCLVERIDAETELIRATFFSHLKLLEETIEDERKNINLTANRKWEENFEVLVEMEEKKLEFRKDRQKFYEAEINRITTEQEDITRATRIRLERDAENLQLELRNTKNNILMNCEKLDYNYQILQKKNEENSIINNQQKRRVAKINENIAALKKKIEQTKISSEHTIKKMSEEVVRLHSKITDLECKTEQFHINNTKKYDQVWEINYNEAMGYLNKILDIDKIIYEQHLGLTWVRPDIPVLKKEKKTTFSKSSIEEKKSILPAISESSHDETRFLRNILRKISEKALFLIESKLIKIMDQEPMTDMQKCLVRIDNIFQALNITNIDDVNSLTEYFKPYSWCPNCSKSFHQNIIQKLFLFDSECDTVAVDTIASSSDTVNEQSVDKTEITNLIPEDESTSDVVQFSDLDEDVNNMLKGNERESSIAEFRTGDKPEKRRFRRDKFCENHFLVIEPALVLTALREFSEKHLYKNTLGSDLHVVKSKSTKEGGKSTNKKDVKKFWTEFLNVFPEEKQKLWKSLEHGLNHFLDVLKQRETLDKECEFLRQQNAELKHLLQRYL